ncbi:putative peroxisomal membrane protein [Lineolata rhizophorae]|uniref:Putative peroxisomal membrane protein n=1 Tax=Lineolata rhizophorae TaxID=578093 RepID=A0A6A6P2V3_9PEZI|nr:putative peroxisomal membrane protein [Lineolata rhizophorae]
MAPLKVGDKFPSGIEFAYAPITDPSPTACGMMTTFSCDTEFANKRVVLVSVPGAFTPTCQANHLPPYLSSASALAAKGVDLICVIATNDAWVMAAWGKANGVPPESESNVRMLSDSKSEFGKRFGWSLGERNNRFAMVVEKDGTVSYAECEEKPGVVTVSGAEAVMAKL